MAKPPTNDASSRREFLRAATSSIGLVFSAATISALVQSCEVDESSPTPPGSTTVTFDVSKSPELAVVGGITITVISGLNSNLPVFISRVADSAFVVFSAICTHQSCTVDLPVAPGENCMCPCHGAQYSATDGRNVVQPISGSATDLPKFASSYDATSQILTITT